MDDKKQPGEPFQIPVQADDAAQAGHFSNVARISHNAEAFQLDFLVIHSQPPFARLQSRLILTPGHAKRLLRALQENLQRYEEVHGEIRVHEAPTPPQGYVQ